MGYSSSWGWGFPFLLRISCSYFIEIERLPSLDLHYLDLQPRINQVIPGGSVDGTDGISDPSMIHPRGGDVGWYLSPLGDVPRGAPSVRS